MRVPGIPYIQGRNSYTDTDGNKYGIAIHNTSNDAPAEGEASYATRRTDRISAHFYVDKDSVVQSLDTSVKAGHAGSVEGNENAIAFEITGVNEWSRTQWLNNVAWDKLGQVIAYLLNNEPDLRGFQVRRASVAEMRFNPRIKAFYGHDDMRLAWGGTTHTDPGPNFPWDRLFKAVNDALNTEDDMGLPQADIYHLPTGFAFDEEGVVIDRSKILTLPLPTPGVKNGNVHLPFGPLYVSAQTYFYGGGTTRLRVAVNDGVTWHIRDVDVAEGPRVGLPLPEAVAGKLGYAMVIGRKRQSIEDKADDAPTSILVEIGKA